MAFPTMQTADAQSGVVTTNSTSWTLTYPTNLASGDLILGFVAADGTGAKTDTGFPASWGCRGVWINESGNAVSCVVGMKISDGTETGTFTWTALASEQGGWRVARVTGWFGSGLPAAGLAGIEGTGAAVPSFAAGTSTTPNMVSLDPANWAAEDTLWVVFCGVDTSRTFSAWPASYTPGNNTWDNVSGGAGGASLSVAHRQLNASSEDPGAWTISTSDEWCALGVAVRPVASAFSAPFPNDFPRLVRKLRRY